MVIDLRKQLDIIFVEVVGESFKFLLTSPFDLFGHHADTCLLGAFGLAAIVLGLDVGVEGRIGKVAFSATALKVPAFFVFSGPTGCGFF